MHGMIARIADFLQSGIWVLRLKDLPPLKAAGLRILRVVVFATRKFVSDRGEKTAAVLTYYSLLNVVPVLAVAFAIAKGFGLEKIIEQQIVRVAEQANWQAEATDYLLSFSHNLLRQAKGGVIAGVGAVFLLWTVISILGKIEGSLNDIWEIGTPRTLIRKFSDYMAMMLLGPVLLVVSSSATVVAASKIHLLLQSVAAPGVFSSAVTFVINLLPYLSIWVLLTALYLIMPNGRIPLRSAVTGGISAGTIMQIVQWAYIKFQIGVSSYGAIYGSFAALPLFLGWLQMSWMIVLFGAEVAYASGHYESYGFHPDYSRLSPAARKLLMLRVFHVITKRFHQGDSPLTAREIAKVLEIPIRLVASLLKTLTALRLIIETTTGRRHEAGFQPGRSIENITVKSVLDDYEKYGEIAVPDYRSEDAAKLSGCLKDISEAMDKSPGNVYVKQI